MLLVSIITVIIGGAITGYFKIRETQIPIEATLTAEIKQEIKLVSIWIPSAWFMLPISDAKASG